MSEKYSPEIIQRLAALFAGHEEWHGVYNGIPEASDSEGKRVGSHRKTTRGETGLDHFRDHIEGKSGLGVVPIRSDSTVCFGAIDIDVYADLRHQDIAQALGDLPLIVVRSKSGGAHLYVFTSEPVPAALMVTRLKEIASMLGYTGCEIFPKQTAPTEKGGSWINIPYFRGVMGMRYAIAANGNMLDLEQFIDAAENARQSRAWFDEPLVIPELKKAADSEAAAPTQAGDRISVTKIRNRALRIIGGPKGHGRDNAGFIYFSQLRLHGYGKDEGAKDIPRWLEKALEKKPDGDGNEYTEKDAKRNLDSAYRGEPDYSKKWDFTKPNSDGKEGSQADKLFQLFDDFEYFHSGPARDAYVRMTIGSHREVWSLGKNGGRVREILTYRYYEKFGRAPSAEALTSAVETIRAKCGAGANAEVYVRFARSRDAIYLDLCDEEWRAVKITAAGWEVVKECSILFRRPNGALPLPEPVRGGKIQALRSLFNVEDDQWVLMLGWLIGAFLPEGAFPHLVIEGAKGSGKSTAVSMLQRFLDPSTAELAPAPKNEEDAILSALNAGILAFDNMSGCRADFSDTLCRFSTGAAFRTRTFYSNTEITLITVRLPCLLNGIDAGIMRDDLLDRSIMLNLPYILPTNRKSEAYVWRAFHESHSACLGAMLDAVVTGLRNLDAIVLPSAPRMVDFATWVTACESALPWESGNFVRAFIGRQKESNLILIESHELGQAIRELVVGEDWIPAGGYVEVSLDEFFQKLNPVDLATGRPLTKHDPKYWPQSPVALGRSLKRLQSLLKEGGIEIEKLERTKAVRSRWRIERRDGPIAPQSVLEFREAA